MVFFKRVNRIESNKEPEPMQSTTGMSQVQLALCLLLLTIVQLYPEKAKAPHSSALAWRIPWTEEPGRLQSMESLGQTRLSDFTVTFHSRHWRRKWQPTPVFLPGESQGQQSLVGCRLWGRTESDTTDAT